MSRYAETNPSLAQGFSDASRRAEGQSKFVRASERFPLTAVGDVNLYPLFAEHDLLILGERGRAAVVVPTGMVTDSSTSGFTRHLVDSRQLASLFDFENRENIFPGVGHGRFRFSLLTMARQSPKESEFAFLLGNTDQLRDGRRRFMLSFDDFARLNPNTRTCPVFGTRDDADLSRAIYRRVPVLVDEAECIDPWHISFMRMFDMSNDSQHFLSVYSPGLSPLFEAKFFWYYNHRLGTYLGRSETSEDTELPRATIEQLKDPSFQITPRYWLEKDRIEQRLGERWDHSWLLAFRDVTHATNERTAIFSFLPRVAVGHKAPILMSNAATYLIPCLAANLNSIVSDYLVRQKVGGLSLAYFILQQVPILPPSAYTRADLDFIVPRVLELTYTAWDLKPFAEDLGYDGPPFVWNEDRRAVLRAELDAYYASLYGLTRDELRYILDPSDVYGPDFPGETFRVLKNNEIKRYGEFRTQRLVLEAWDRLGLAPRNRDGRYDPNAAPVEDVGTVVTLVPAPATPVDKPAPAEIAAVDEEQTFAQISPLLEFAIENRFPFPIARAFYQLKETSEPAAEATQLANIVGVTVEYLALVCVASYLASDTRDAAFDILLRDKIGKPVSHGTWIEVIRETLDVLASGSGSAFFDELSAQYLPQAGDRTRTNLKELTDRMVTLRNSVLKRTAGDLPSTDNVRELKRALLRALQALGFLTDYPLVAAHATTVADGVKIHQCRLLTGFHESFTQTTVQCDLDLERDRPALLNLRTREILYLDPLYTLRQCPTAVCDRVHLFAVHKVGSKDIEYVAPGGHKLKDRPAAVTFDTALRFPGSTTRGGQAQHLYLGNDSLAAQGALPRGHRIAGKYELLRRIGRGGMADVYESRRLSDGMSVALKLFPAQFLANHTLVNRFRTEAAQARDLYHPNVARVLDYGQGLFEMYLVMELAQGWPMGNGTRALDLSQLGRPLSMDQTVDIARQACEALECVHQHNVVHRDVKPANLLLCADGQVKLADFGIARAREQIAMTMTGNPMGTPEYMSPEQTEGSHELTPASDVYSLGVVLYELLTGQNPFKRAAPLATMAAQSTFKPAAPSAVLPSIPHALDRVIMRCLEKEPEKRFRSARELYQALAKINS